MQKNVIDTACTLIDITSHAAGVTASLHCQHLWSWTDSWT